jgi:ABC-type nitrate/sulfonate/bicarbonate transport system substrate-binding protein
MRLALLALLAVAGLLAGCGSNSTPHTGGQGATLVLDFTPNAVHTGIYAAIARGYDRAEGVTLHVVAPTASTDSVKLLATGRAPFAILDIHDLAIARERGADIVGIMAIVERPLAAVIAVPDVASPRELDGRVAGVTGDPSDYAVLRSVVAGAGGDPRSIRTVTIGFNAVPALLSGRVAAATAFWNDEGVTLAHLRPGFHVFRVDDYGAPSYPELVLCASRATIRSQPRLVRAVVSALARGYAFAYAHPGLAAVELDSLVAGLDPHLVAEQLAAERPVFVASNGQIGALDLPELHRWAVWEARFGIVSRPPYVAAMFDPRFIESAAAARAG